MADTVLVTYATQAGSTADVAMFIGKTLAERGMNTDVKPMADVVSLDGYSSVVIGSGVRAGKLYSAAVKFVKKHKDGLAQVPAAAFVVCLTMKDDTPENRKTAAAFLDPIRAEISLVDAGLFGGAMDCAKLGFLPRFVIKHMVKAPEGNFSDWKAIEEWAAGLASTLKA